MGHRVRLNEMILKLYISHNQLIFKQNQVDSPCRRSRAAAGHQAGHI
jgi:hypothetical protein